MKKGHRRICLSLLAALCWLTAAAQRDSLAYRLTPFVKGGLTVGFLDGMDQTEGGHTGFHLNAGVRIPFRRGDSNAPCLVPSLRFIVKGETLERVEGSVFLNMQFVELPIVMAYHIRNKKWQCVLGAGVFVGYGVGGRLTGSDRFYNYHGYRLADKPAAFGPEVGVRRWDYGLSFMYDFQYKNFIFSFDVEKGLHVLVPSKFNYSNENTTVAISLGIGYAL